MQFQVPRGFVYSHTELEHEVAGNYIKMYEISKYHTGDQLGSMVVKATVLASKVRIQFGGYMNCQHFGMSEFIPLLN